MMSDSRIFGHTLKMMGKSLDIAARRHVLVSSNIANMDTIGYTPQDLNFDRSLQLAMGEGKEPDYLSKTHARHMAPPDPWTQGYLNGEDSEAVDVYHLDSVNIDTEMMHLMENNIKYKTTTELLLRKMKNLNYSIEEGGK